MSVYVGFKIGKARERRAYISEYYCGGCGWPVSDHDSYCNECGGAFREEDATERTCRNVSEDKRTFECSECAYGYPDLQDFKHCPECGARIIGDDE